jgi:hypothetical protein
MTKRTVWIVDEQVVPESGRSIGECRERREHQLSFDDERRVQPEAGIGNHRRLLEGCPFIGRIDEENDVAQFSYRVDKHLVRVGTGQGRSSERKSSPRVGLSEDDVVHDESSRRAGQVIEQHRVDSTRPGPAPRIRLKVAQAVLVDFDEGEILSGRRRIGRLRQTPVVRLQFDCLKRMESWVAGAAREDGIEPEDRRSRDNPDGDSSDDFSHRWSL